MIPRSFTMANRKWKVKLVDNEDMRLAMARQQKALLDAVEEPTPLGLCDPILAVIYLNVGKHFGNEESLQHTFFHELAHVIKFSDGVPSDEQNEQEIDRIGGYLQQYFTTKRGELT